MKKKELAEFKAMVRDTVEEAVVPVSAQVDKLAETLDTVILLLSNLEFRQRANGRRDEVAENGQ